MNSNFGENSLSNYAHEENIGKSGLISGKGAYGQVYKAYDRKNN